MSNALENGVVLGVNSMLNFTFLSSVNPGRLSRKTPENSYTTEVSLTFETTLFGKGMHNPIWYGLKYFSTQKFEKLQTKPKHFRL